MNFITQKIYKLSKTNIFFSRFEGTRGERNQIFRTQVNICHEFLQRSIGICAREYAALKGSSKTEVKNSVKNLSEKLNVFNGLIKLQGKDIIDLVPVNRGHLQQLKNRLK